MRTSLRAFLCLMSLTTVLFLSSSVFATTRMVDSDGFACTSSCDGGCAAYHSIQAAIDRSKAGDTVVVCPGTGPYDEQLLIEKKLIVQGFKNTAVVVKPAAMVDNTSSLATTSPIAAIVLVKDTKGPVALTNLIVDGADSLLACGRNPVGIFFRNASGSVSDSTVRNIRMASGSEGCGGGIGIFAQSGLALTSNVTVKGCNVHNFQKTGIVGNEVGTKLTATTNVVLGDGPISYVAQNGIQIGWGATGSITDNRVSEFAWTPCVDVNNCAWCSTGILLYDPDSLATPGVIANGNIVSHTQCAGVFQMGNSGQVVSNDVSATDPWDGIVVLGNNNTVKSNTVTNSKESGIWVQGDKNSMTLNRIQETPIGIWIDGGTGNSYPTSSGNANTFPNVGTTIGPAATGSALMMMQAGSNADRTVTADRF